MVVNLTSTIELSGLNDIQMQSIKDTIKNSGIDVSVRSDVIFIETAIDNSENYVESLALYLASELPSETKTIMSVKSDNLDVVGDSLEGYYDIVIQDGAAVIVPYTVTPNNDMAYKVEVN